MSRRKIPGGWSENKDGTRSWILTYRRPDTGRQAQKSFRGKAAKERAAAFYDELQHADRTGTYVAPESGTKLFRELAIEWANTQDWSPSTRAAFDSQLNRFDKYLGESVQIGQVDEAALLELRRLLSGDYANSTAKITLHYACAVMRTAYRRGLVPKDVTIAVDPPKDRTGKKQGKQPEDVPTRSEVVAMIGHAPDEWRAGFVLLASGLRISEMLGTHSEQFDRATGEFFVDRQLDYTGKGFKLPKRDKTRHIVLPGWASEAVAYHLDEYQGRGLLFRNRLGEPRRRDTFHDYVWHPTLKRAGIETRYVPHSLRHFCASSLLADGQPPVAVAGHLGDTIETMSKTYAHWMPEDRAVTALALDRILGNTRPLSVVPGPIVRSALDRPDERTA